MKRFSFVVPLLVGSLFSVNVLADKDHDKQHHNKKKKYQTYQTHPTNIIVQTPMVSSTSGLLNVALSTAMIYALNRELNLPVHRYEPLPYGIRKNIKRGKRLPKGIAKKQLPYAYVNRLPHYPGYDWIAVGRDLVLVSVATMVVQKVVQNAFGQY